MSSFSYSNTMTQTMPNQFYSKENSSLNKTFSRIAKEFNINDVPYSTSTIRTRKIPEKSLLTLTHPIISIDNSSYKNDRVQRTLSTMGKTINKESIPPGQSFRNRPVPNLDLFISCKMNVMDQIIPSCTDRVMVTAPSKRQKKTYLDNVFEFSDRRAGEIMVPRTDMVCLYLEDSFEENVRVAVKEKMTRYPVCDEDKDHVVGVIHVIDLLQASHTSGKNDLRKLMRAPIIVPESIEISKLLRMLQKRRAQLAILSDEYGGTAGIVTMEDILEEIVGEIQDEFDDSRNEIIELGEKTYSVDGVVLLEQINDLFELDMDIEDVDVDTIGGWIGTKVEYPPRVGKQVVTDGAIFTIEEMEKVRITRVHIEVLHVPETAHDDIVAEYPQETM